MLFRQTSDKGKKRTVLLRGLEENWDKETLADRLAAALADKWRRKGMGQPHHHNRGQEKG